MKSKKKKVKTKAKAIALFSGGLDSILAVKLIQEQRIEIIGFHAISPLFPKKVNEEAKQLKIKVIEIDMASEKNIIDFINIIRSPKFGFGSAINPCIDCKILMLKKAKEIMEKEKADFIVTGEVLGERPMSQTMEKLGLIELESGLEGKILRPLSARLLPETEPEKKGIVDRKKLLAIQGRQRIQQIALAKKYNLDYPVPSGGCLLCEKEIAIKMRDLLRNKKDIKKKDLTLLRIGRHFRVGKSKIIVGRNRGENKQIYKLTNEDWIFELKNWPGPATLLEHPTQQAIRIAAALTMAYSDARHMKNVEVCYGGRKFNKCIKINSLHKKEIEKYKIK